MTDIDLNRAEIVLLDSALARRDADLRVKDLQILDLVSEVGRLQSLLTAEEIHASTRQSIPVIRDAPALTDRIAAIASVGAALGVTYVTISVHSDGGYLASIQCRSNADCRAIHGSLRSEGDPDPTVLGNERTHWLGGEARCAGSSIMVYGPHAEGGIESVSEQIDPPGIYEGPGGIEPDSDATLGTTRSVQR